MNISPVQRVTILGSTGSIGVSTLKVIKAHPARYRIFALTANTSVDIIFQQCLEYLPSFAVMADDASAKELREKLAGENKAVEVLSGIDGLKFVASSDAVDTVMAAIVGGAGLIPSLAAAESGKKVLLANKEALVMAGELFMDAIVQSNARLLPIDSEHNAIFQCLPVNTQARFIDEPTLGFEKIVLTASGGPFLNTPLSEMQNITPEQACAHPNWKMGRKISVDSATMLNKALELIEASFLFDTPAEKIDVLMHPQSIVHSMVYYRDGSVLAQLGNPDMCTPIAYGLAWPERIASGVKTLDLVAAGKLEFLAPDNNKFPCLALGREAAVSKGSAPIILNAANEVAVAAFLDERLCFTRIPAIIDAVLNQQMTVKVNSLEVVLDEDRKAREAATALIKKIIN